MMWALEGAVSRELLSYQGKILTHPDRAEIEFLFPMNRVVPLPKFIPAEDTMRLRDHPDMAPITFPLDRREFR